MPYTFVSISQPSNTAIGNTSVFQFRHRRGLGGFSRPIILSKFQRVPWNQFPMTTASTHLTFDDGIPLSSRSSVETRVLELLKNTPDPRQISQICLHYPFQDPRVPLDVLEQRWDDVLESRLKFLCEREKDRINEICKWNVQCKAKEFLSEGEKDRINEICKWNVQCKAKEFLRLLKQGQENHKPDRSSDYLERATYRVKLREWASYLARNEKRIIEGVQHERSIAQQLKSNEEWNVHQNTLQVSPTDKFL
jgi:hypothetical protein